MIFPGVIGQQQLLTIGGGAAGTRPIFVAVQSSAAASGALAVTLPAGWAAGQLAVMHVARGSAAPATPSGWTVVGSTLTSSSGTSALFWRILQGGDSGPTLDTGTNTAAVVWTFEVDTFNTGSPVSEIATNTSGGGLNATPSVGTSSAVTAGEHFVMHLHQTYSAFNTVSSYPYASAQHNRGTGISPAFVANRGCGQNFDGGTSAASQFTISANSNWTSRKIAIIGNGYVP